MNTSPALPAAVLSSVFLRWLLLQGLMLFAWYVLADQGWLRLFWQGDQSRLSVVIGLALVGVSLYAGRRAWCLGAAASELPLPAAGTGLPEALPAWLEREYKAPNEPGWFVADMMVKLGLLGTVIGFILMLGSLNGIEDMDITSIQRMLLQMSEGMRVALFTTLAGLSAGMLAGLQFLMLDRAADRLINRLQSRYSFVPQERD